MTCAMIAWIIASCLLVPIIARFCAFNNVTLDEALRATHARLGEAIAQIEREGMTASEWHALAHDARVLNTRAQEQAEMIRLGLV